MKQSGLSRTLNINLSENLYETSEFFKSVFALYIHKKSRKLANALYLITKHLNNDEPIKNWIRTDASRLIELSVKTREENNPRYIYVFYEEIVNTIARLLSFLEVSVIAGIISEPNYYILNKELNLMFSSLKDRLGDVSNSGDVLGGSFFDVEIKDTTIKDDVFIKDRILKDKEINFNKDKVNIKNNDKISLENRDKTPLSDVYSNKNVIKDKDKSKKLLRKVENIDREKIVLGFLKDKNRLSVKDLSLLLPQYSEKTIQRIVHSLVNKGIISKTGEKRWSLYFLANNDLR